MLAGCKPARTWMLAWLFVLGDLWVFVWVGVFPHPRPHSRSGGFATRLCPFAGLQPAPCLFCSLPRVADPATGAGGLQTRQNVDVCVGVCFGGFVGVCVGVFSSLTSSPTFRRFWNPPASFCGFATRAMLVLFASPGRRPGHGCWRVANPPERGYLFWGICGCLRGCLRGCLFFGGCVFAWLFVKDFCQSCRGKGLQANPLTHKRIRKRPVMQCKTGRLGLPDRPFWRAKEAVWHGHTAGMARRAARCKNFLRCGRRGGRGASSLRQYDAVQAMPAAITRSRMALSCSGVALRSSRSGVSRSMVYIITLPGAMYLTFSSHGPT